jgi:dihydroxy-acid dehydratase
VGALLAIGVSSYGYVPLTAIVGRAGLKDMVRISDARMSGTAYGTIVLHVSPEAAVGGALALLRNGDRVRVDLRLHRVDVLLAEEELEARRAAFDAAGGYRYPPSQTPWQAIQRNLVGQLDTGAILEGAETFQRIERTFGLPRDSH